MTWWLPVRQGVPFVVAEGVTDGLAQRFDGLDAAATRNRCQRLVLAGRHTLHVERHDVLREPAEAVVSFGTSRASKSLAVSGGWAYALLVPCAPGPGDVSYLAGDSQRSGPRLHPFRPV